MSAPPPSVFIVTLEGVEAGTRLTALAFVRAADGAAAEAAGVRELADLGWSAIVALRHGEVVDAEAMPADFAGAMETMSRYGTALIIYDAP
ncbi:hypothetical protein [Phenylobacterium sp.]|uniref:hypothetical protein n=1 Tax=Phenylobacterium sp. TaxID=1871053 RepID=UPI0025FA83A1|nr:hypothetical protein [Phenylobacterium sp.]